MDELPREDILDKIRKVQGYLQSDNPNEAAVAAAKLSEMLIRYKVSLDEIPTDQRKADPFANLATDTVGARLPEWRIILAGGIAKANLCRIVISGSHLQWLGRQSNPEVAQYIYETSAADLQNMADAFWYAIRVTLKDSDVQLVHGKTWKADFLRGAADGVNQKLRAEFAKWQAENTNVNALVVVNDRELASYVREQYPRRGASSHGYASGSNAYGLGVTTGRNHQFKTGVGSGGASGTRQLGRG